MERIRGLEEYVKNKEYREALGLPKEKTENYELLAQGEYNINYAFTHPVTGKKLLLRVNCGSQMHLEHQIEYEAHALRLMEGSGRTPKVLYVDGSNRPGCCRRTPCISQTVPYQTNRTQWTEYRSGYWSSSG